MRPLLHRAAGRPEEGRVLAQENTKLDKVDCQLSRPKQSLKEYYSEFVRIKDHTPQKPIKLRIRQQPEVSQEDLDREQRERESQQENEQIRQRKLDELLNQKTERYQMVKNKYFEGSKDEMLYEPQSEPKAFKPSFPSKLKPTSQIFDPEFIRDNLLILHDDDDYYDQTFEVRPPPGLLH